MNHELPNGWSESVLNDLFSFVIGGDWGFSPETDESDLVDVYCIRGTEFKLWDNELGNTKVHRKIKENSLEKRKLNVGDLVIEISGGGPEQPVGRVVLVTSAVLSVKNEYPNVCTNFMRLARPSPEVYPAYIYYYLKLFYLSGKVENYQGGSNNLRNLKFKDYCKISVPIPPISEQIRIADKLDRTLARVNAAQARLDKIPTLIKRFRQSVLAAATSGELTQEWRNSNFFTTNEMLDGYEPLPKPSRYQTRNLGFIPGVIATAVGMPDEPPVSAWKWVPLIDVAEMGSGHTPSRSNSEYWDGDICWVGIKDAREHHGGTIYDTIQKTNSLGLENSAARLLPENTICISRTASVGYVVRLGQPMATSQDFVTWTPTEVIDPDWLKWLFVSEREALFKFGRGSTHTTIYFPEWLSLHIALPPLQEQKEIVRRVESLFALADTVEKQYQDAKARTDRLTQAILAKAFRGELVPQNPDDEPAEALLQRIQQQRAEQATAGKRGKARKVSG